MTNTTTTMLTVKKVTTITITAKATSVSWNMGDGTTVSCDNPGTPFENGKGGQPSPTCGHVYFRPSRDQPDGRYTVVATTAWRVDWAGGGFSGVIDTETVGNATVQINEMQVVNK